MKDQIFGLLFEYKFFDSLRLDTSDKILSFKNIFYTILKSCLFDSVHAAFCKGIVERPIDLVTFFHNIYFF